VVRVEDIVYSPSIVVRIEDIVHSEGECIMSEEIEYQNISVDNFVYYNFSTEKIL
jgi:hypothetical protein